MKKLLYSIGTFVFDMCTNNKTTTILIRLTLILAVCALLSRIVRAIITPLIIVIALFGFISCEKPMCYDVEVLLVTKIYSNGVLYQVNPHCSYTETHCNMTYHQLKKWCEWSSKDSIPITNYVVGGCLLDSITAFDYRYYEIINQ